MEALQPKRGGNSVGLEPVDWVAEARAGAVSFCRAPPVRCRGCGSGRFPLADAGWTACRGTGNSVVERRRAELHSAILAQTEAADNAGVRGGMSFAPGHRS